MFPTKKNVKTNAYHIVMNASVLHTATNLEILIIATFALMIIYPMHLMTLDSIGETVSFQMRKNISVHSDCLLLLDI